MREEQITKSNINNKRRAYLKFETSNNVSQVDDFLKDIAFHCNRVLSSEAKSLKRLEISDRKAKILHERIVAAWAEARILLVDAVREIDATIQPLHLSLSMSDDVIHDGLAGAVEVRLHRVGGGLPRSLLDIEVDLGGHHRTCVHDTRFPVQVNLPPIGMVRREDYRIALMVFVHDVMRTTMPRAARRCPHCAQPTLTFARIGSTIDFNEADEVC